LIADEATFVALILVGSEIDNGGFAQLFTNSTTDVVPDTIAGAGPRDQSPLAELARALAYPKIRERIAEDEASALVGLLRQKVRLAPDPVLSPRVAPPIRATST
jgi:hypothetical protein